MPHPTATFEQLCTPHLPRLRRVALRLTRNPADAEDLVQESLCRAWSSWHRVQAGGNIGAYLCRIATNAFISRRRHQQVVQRTANRPDLHDHLIDPGRRRAARHPEDALTEDRLCDEVVGALDTLPVRYREVVELVDLQGLPYRDTADELGVPLGTVMSRLHRARRALREQLAAFAASRGLPPLPAAA